MTWYDVVLVVVWVGVVFGVALSKSAKEDDDV